MVADRESVILEYGRRHPTFFARLMRRNYQTAEMHWRIGKALQRVEAGEIDRLMIFCPPRHGKSTITSLAFPAWYLGRNPDKRIIAASYGDALARGFGRGARNLIGLPLYQRLFPGIGVARDSAAADAWSLVGRDGGYVATSVGGAITGLGADVLIIDDPIKGREEADSQVIRDKTWAWYTDDAYTRLEHGGSIVVIQTRWHEDDLAGRLLAEQEAGGDQWTVLSLPALSDAGEPLWPEKYDEQALERIKQSVSARTFSALYQQRPAPAEGGLFKAVWFKRRYELLPEDRPRWIVVQAIDTAYREGVANDYSAIGTWATDGISYYLLDQWRGRVDFPSLVAEAEQRYWRWKPRIVLIEDAVNGLPLIQSLKRNSAVPVLAVKAKGSKEARADAITPLFESDRVVLPQHALWLSDWISEHLSFPQGTHDDQVDTTSMALGWLYQRSLQDGQTVEMQVSGNGKHEPHGLRERILAHRSEREMQQMRTAGVRRV